MRSMYGILGTISAFAFRHRETKKTQCRGGRSQDRLASNWGGVSMPRPDRFTHGKDPVPIA